MSARITDAQLAELRKWYEVERDDLDDLRSDGHLDVLGREELARSEETVSVLAELTERRAEDPMAAERCQVETRRALDAEATAAREKARADEAQELYECWRATASQVAVDRDKARNDLAAAKARADGAEANVAHADALIASLGFDCGSTQCLFAESVEGDRNDDKCSCLQNLEDALIGGAQLQEALDGATADRDRLAAELDRALAHGLSDEDQWRALKDVLAMDVVKHPREMVARVRDLAAEVADLRSTAERYARQYVELSDRLVADRDRLAAEVAHVREGNGATWRDQLVAVCEAIGANDAAEVIARIGPMARELAALRAVREAAARVIDAWRQMRRALGLTRNEIWALESAANHAIEALAACLSATPGGDR